MQGLCICKGEEECSLVHNWDGRVTSCIWPLLHVDSCFLNFTEVQTTQTSGISITDTSWIMIYFCEIVVIAVTR